MNFTPNEVRLFDNSENVETDLVEYNRILALHRDLPGDMFVNQLLLDYHQSETNLDHLRITLFEMLKNTEDFPFELDSELKRRVNTRQGEPIVAKLAKDIHTLISVIEGEDSSCLKELISSGKRQPRTGSLSKNSGIAPNVTQSGQVNCNCSAELKQLKEMVVALQADLLLMKQRQAGTENLRNSEIIEIKKSIQDLDTVLNSQSTIT